MPFFNTNSFKLLASLFCIILSSCSSTQPTTGIATTDFNITGRATTGTTPVLRHGASFSWEQPIFIPGANDQSIAKRITALIESELTRKGFVLTNKAGDFSLSAEIHLNKGHRNSTAALNPGLVPKEKGVNTASLTLTIKEHGRSSRWTGVAQVFHSNTLSTEQRQQRNENAVNFLLNNIVPQ